MATANVLRPKSGVTRRVWDIADELTAAMGRKAGRADVIDKATHEGIHLPTASKQYNDWRQAYDDRQGAAQGGAEAPVVPFEMHLQIGPDGRILIPVEFRRLMKLGPDGRVNAEWVDGELRLFSPAVALEKLQAFVARHDRGQGSVVDELLAERRREADTE